MSYKVIALLATCALALLPFAFQEQEQEKSDDKIVIPGQGAEAESRRDFMRTKLLFSKNIFEGLTTGNFNLVNEGIEEVQRVTEGSAWVDVDDERYQKLTSEFKTTIKRLKEAAATKNIDATALRYYQMSTSCIDCHKHIRVAGYEF